MFFDIHITMTLTDCLITLVVNSSTELQALFALMTIAFIITFVIAVWFIYNLFKQLRNRQNVKGSKLGKDRKYFFIFLSILSILIILGAFFTTIDRIVSSHYEFAYSTINYEKDIYPICNDLSQLWQITWNIRAFFQASVYILFPVLYYIRLKLILKGSIYQLTRKEKILFNTSVIIEILMTSISIIFVSIVDISNDNISEKLWINNVVLVLIAIFLIDYLFQIFYLWYLLKQQVKKLVALFLSVDENKDNNNNNNNSNNGNTTRLNQAESFLVLLKKLTSLAFVGLSSSLILFCVWPFLDGYQPDRTRFGQVLIHLGLQIDNIINLLCIAAQFEFGNKIYQLFCQKIESIIICA